MQIFTYIYSLCTMAYGPAIAVRLFVFSVEGIGASVTVRGFESTFPR